MQDLFSEMFGDPRFCDPRTGTYGPLSLLRRIVTRRHYRPSERREQNYGRDQGRPQRCTVAGIWPNLRSGTAVLVKAWRQVSANPQ